MLLPNWASCILTTSPGPSCGVTWYHVTIFECENLCQFLITWGGAKTAKIMSQNTGISLKKVEITEDYWRLLERGKEPNRVLCPMNM